MEGVVGIECRRTRKLLVSCLLCEGHEMFCLYFEARYASQFSGMSMCCSRPAPPFISGLSVRSVNFGFLKHYV